MFCGIEIDDVVRAGTLGRGYRVYFHGTVAFELCGDDGCQFLGCAIHGAPLSWFGICVAQALLPARCACENGCKRRTGKSACATKTLRQKWVALLVTPRDGLPARVHPDPLFGMLTNNFLDDFGEASSIFLDVA